MSHKKHDTLIGSLLLVTGAIIGAASVLFYKENRPKRPGVVLEEVKQQFRDQGDIEGSWIHYDPIEYTKIESEPLVYVGGITRLEEGKAVEYHFACDIYSGEVLDLFVVGD